VIDTYASTLRDIGRVLGVTFQRAKQLVDEAAQAGQQNRG
jgi:hypothetical protein